MCDQPFTRVARRTIPALLFVAIMLVGGPAGAGVPVTATYHLTNEIACTRNGNNLVCGPPLVMRQGGNGSFPSGLVLVQHGHSRVWIADAAPSADFGTRTWTVHLGGTSVVAGLRWSVGTWDWGAGDFVPAAGPETQVAVAQLVSTFTPTSPFLVPASRHLALRVTGDSPEGLPSLIDVWGETGAPGPSSLSV